MIRKIALIFILCTCYKMNAQQIKYVSRDTLLYIFKTNNIYDAIDNIRNVISYERGSLDYKNIYFDKELKEYFLKSLDRNSRCQYKTENEIKKYRKLLNGEEFLKSEIRGYLYERKRGKQIDSILKSETLIKKFKDSVLEQEIYLEKKRNNYKNAIPNLHLITKIKYLEAYDSIKKWNKELPEWNFTEELLAFNDPESKREFDKRVANYVKNNGTNESYRYFLDVIREINTAYGYSKLLDLIAVNKVEITMQAPVFNVDGVVVDTDNSESPVSFLLLGSVNLLHWVNHYKLPYENLIIQNELLLGSDVKKQDEFIKKNLPEIKKALLDIVKIKEKEEEYWMKNMPYYKK